MQLQKKKRWIVTHKFTGLVVVWIDYRKIYQIINDWVETGDLGVDVILMKLDHSHEKALQRNL